jgi:mRNA-degrading endonuclease RelE of RelBE toxin-antitoxin system
MNPKLMLKVAASIEQVIAANTVSDIVNIKKLSGFKYHYRIRIGNYRVGIVIKNNEVMFERFYIGKIFINTTLDTRITY